MMWKISHIDRPNNLTFVTGKNSSFEKFIKDFKEKDVSDNHTFVIGKSSLKYTSVLISTTTLISIEKSLRLITKKSQTTIWNARKFCSMMLLTSFDNYAGTVGFMSNWITLMVKERFALKFLTNRHVCLLFKLKSSN